MYKIKKNKTNHLLCMNDLTSYIRKMIKNLEKLLKTVKFFID